MTLEILSICSGIVQKKIKMYYRLGRSENIFSRPLKRTLDLQSRGIFMTSFDPDLPAGA